MVRQIDCAVLALPASDVWLDGPWRESALGPLRLQRLPLAGDGHWDGVVTVQAAYAPGPALALARLAPALQRFDLCVLPVAPGTLAWTRAALAAVRGALPVPLVLLTHGLSACAVQDLLWLGAADFVAHGARPEELKARLRRWSHRSGGPAHGAARPRREPPAPDIVARTLGALAAPPPMHDSFRLTRAQVLADFERDYITSMLLRFHGNVTQAARAGSQDRRAFSQLARKHGVAPADFRRAAAMPEEASR